MKIEANLRGLGIGSLPFTDPREAVALIRETLPEIPHWPQLPKRGKSEHFIHQCLNPLVQLEMVALKEDHIVFDAFEEQWTDKLTEFYTNFLTAQETAAAPEWFAIPYDSAVGFYAFLEDIQKNPGATTWVKGQLAGPLSVALNITDTEKKPAYYHEQMRDVLVKTLAMQGRWQAVKLRELGFPAMVFVDEPAISAMGVSTYITLTKEQLVNDLAEICREIHAGGALAGAHSCAAVDWSVFMDAGYDIISFDAYEYFPSLLGHVSALADYLQRGGSLAWGIIPTSYKVMEEGAAGLKEKFNEQQRILAAKGIPAALLRSRTFVAPSCGTGALSREEAEKVYRLVKNLAGEM